MTGRRRQRDEQTRIPLPSIPEEMTHSVVTTTGRQSLLLVRGAVAGAKLKKTAVIAISAVVIVVAASGLLSAITGTPAADDSSVRRSLKVKAPSATKGPAAPVITGYDARRTAAGMDRPRGRPVSITNANTNSNTHRQQRRQAQRRQQEQKAQLLANRVANAQQRELRQLSENWEDLPTSRQLAELQYAQSYNNHDQHRDLDATEREARKLFQHIPSILHLVIINPNTLNLLDPDAPQIPPPPYWQPLLDYTRRDAYARGYKSKVWTIEDADELVDFQYDHLYDTWQRLKSTAEPRRISNFIRLLALHAFGGVYLDLDVLPCAGLDELVTAESGVASFPYTDPGTGYVWNGAMSSPPVHRVIGLALQYINENLRSHSGDVDEMTGSGPLVKGLRQYGEELGVGDLLKVYHREGVPVDGIRVSLALRGGEGGDGGPIIGRWYQSGVVRLGTYPREARPNRYLSLWYVAVDGVGAEDSPCATDVDLIRPWIEGQCQGVSDVVASNPFRTKQTFAQCGLDEEDLSGYTE